MFGNIGFGEIILIALIALLLFGPNKLPELGRTLGKTLREFKQGTSGILNDEPSTPERKDVTPATPSQEIQQPSKASAIENRGDSRRLPD